MESLVLGKTILGRKTVCLTPMSVAQALTFLLNEVGCESGVLLEKNSGAPVRYVAGTGRAKLVRLQELFDAAKLNPTNRSHYDDTVVFVPCVREDYPRTSVPERLYRWAIANRLPYLYLHDNDHAWFSRFHDATRKRLFLWYLRNSFLNWGEGALKLAGADWRAVKEGMFTHGWTLDHSHCSYNDGVAIFRIWAGTSQTTFFRWEEAYRLSGLNKMLSLEAGNDGQLSLAWESRCCPLED